MMSTVLVTGATGMLGTRIVKYFRDHGWDVTRMVRSPSNETDIKVDFADPNHVAKVIDGHHFDVLIHCAAIVNLKVCHDDPQLAQRVHIESTRKLAESEICDRFVYISTDSVFDGQGSLYREDSATSPLNVYAKTKLQGEFAASRHSSATIVRTNLYGLRNPPQSSLVEWATKRLAAGETVPGFTNVEFNPLHLDQVASVIHSLLNEHPKHKGLLNLGNETPMSKFDFLVRIAEIWGAGGESVAPVTHDSSAQDISRPLNTTLCIDRLKTLLPNGDYSLQSGLERIADSISKRKETS